MDKKITIGINSCGITGLSVARAILQRNDVELVAINTLRDASDLASDFKVDTGISKGHSRYNFSDKGVLYFDKKPPVTVLNFPNKPPVTVFHEKDPANIPWDSAGVDIVVESSDLLTNKFDAAAHLKGGAMKVIISGGSKNAPTFVVGVNEHEYNSSQDLDIISSGSSVVNCIAPLVKVIKNRFFFSEALVTNVPTITANRQTVYGPTASFNTIPRSTSATETEVFGYVFPSLSGKLNVFQFSLPTVGVSAVDLTIRLEKAATYDDIKKAFN